MFVKSLRQAIPPPLRGIGRVRTRWNKFSQAKTGGVVEDMFSLPQLPAASSEVALGRRHRRTVEDDKSLQKVCRFFKVQKVHDVIGKIPFTPWTDLMCKCYGLYRGTNSQYRPLCYLRS